MRTLVLSASKIGIAQTCAEKYNLHYNQRLRTYNRASYLETGDLMHHMLDVYYRLKMLGDINVEDSVDAAVEMGRLHGNAELDLTPAEIEENVSVFREYCIFYADETWVPTECEAPFSKILFEDEEYIDAIGEKGLRILIEGKLDLTVEIGRNRVVVDHKTGKRRSEPHIMNNQWACYCWAKEVNNVVVNQVGYQKTVQKFHRPTVSLSDNQLNEWKNDTIKWGKQIHDWHMKNEFTRNRTGCDSHFSSCQFTDICGAEIGSRENIMRSLFTKSLGGSLYSE